MLKNIMWFCKNINGCKGRISIIKIASARLRVGLKVRLWIKKRWCFWISFRFGGSNISAMFLCCRGYIVKFLCSRWRHSWRCRNRLWNEQPRKFKLGDCCYISAEEAFDKMESSWKSDFRVMVSDGGSRVFYGLFQCCS